jgi:hypothetical protein
MLLTRILAGLLVWLSIALYFAAMGVLTYFCWQKKLNYGKMGENVDGTYTFEE